ncbi:MAG: anaerobic ribonucleoside-triphosphate reductase activating protein [Candidatus Muirbacterium halophilum]|nr:anaerobic ribonucleoside-triphosphate reductase activating protein [Candidatus Muirbacterium halophilum]MCK9474886.1 anaerobic ribonucleoside-triphosphate reductase activating protein [Candidatus Muirbacterium halophilum]
MLKIGGLAEHSLVDYPGKIASVIFTRGCDFRCPFCHNHELTYSKGDCIEFSYVLERLEANKKWIDALVITGGEPLLNSDIIDFASFVKKKTDLLIKVDTNGNSPQMLDAVIKSKVFDFIAMDIKHDLISEKYNKAAGRIVDIDNIVKSIGLIAKSGIDYQFRTTFVPTLHTKEDIIKILNLGGVKNNYSLQNFSNSKTLDPEFMDIPCLSSDEFDKMKNNLNIV